MPVLIWIARWIVAKREHKVQGFSVWGKYEVDIEVVT